MISAMLKFKALNYCVSRFTATGCATRIVDAPDTREDAHAGLRPILKGCALTLERVRDCVGKQLVAIFTMSDAEYP